MRLRLICWLLIGFVIPSYGEPPSPLPSPEAQAKKLGVRLPKLPWHMANIWWDFQGEIKNVESVSIEVSIDREIPATYNLYIAPIGLARLNGLDLYAGLQTNINGWNSKTSRKRVFPGKGIIFSRWSHDKKTPLNLDHARLASNGMCESAGYEGEFCSVRRPYAWTKGTYTFSLVKGDQEQEKGKPNTWFHCLIRSHKDNSTTYVGSLRFEGKEFTYWARHSAFVEIYETAKIPRSGIPQVCVTFGYPRINGKRPVLKSAFAIYPTNGISASPSCAKARAEGHRVVVDVGELFLRKKSAQRHPLKVTP